MIPRFFAPFVLGFVLATAWCAHMLYEVGWKQRQIATTDRWSHTDWEMFKMRLGALRLWVFVAVPFVVGTVVQLISMGGALLMGVWSP